MEAGHIVDAKYEIVKKIGKGAFSNCYLANVITDQAEEPEEQVVLKIALRPEFSLASEVIISSELTPHNGLIKYFYHGVTQIYDSVSMTNKDHEYIVAEHMVNGDLYKYVTNKGFDEKCARYLFKNALDALEFLHNDGYAHLDIKLGNILLDKNFNPKLWDFGFIQRVHKDGLLDWKEFNCKGTKHYIWPEIYGDESFNPQAADIFALGVTFFVLLVSDYPFDKAVKSDKKYQNLYGKNPFIFWKKHSRAKKKISKGLISDSFIDLITKMLIPIKEDRITIKGIKDHEWFQEPWMSASDAKDYFEALKIENSC